MIITVAVKTCNICGGTMFLEWSNDDIDWVCITTSPIPNDTVRLRMRCEECGHIEEDPNSDPEIAELSNRVKYHIVTQMIRMGIYSYP